MDCGCAVTTLCMGMPNRPKDGIMPMTSCGGLTEGSVP